MTKITRPVLRYFGGKFRLRSWILGFFPPHRIYVEPFGGAASVLLAKAPAFAEVYNDLDGELVNLFRVLRNPRQAKRLQAQLELTPFARAEFEASYQPARDPVERARRLVVRCFLGFGATAHNSAARTGFRGKSWRQRSTGVDDWQTYPAQIPAMTARLRRCLIECRPAAEMLARHDGPDTLFYADPPYVHASRGRHHDTKSRYVHELTDDDQRALAQQLRGCRGMVVLSGYRSALYDELYADWERHETDALADGARKRRECVWLNPATVTALRASRVQLEMA